MYNRTQEYIRKRSATEKRVDTVNEHNLAWLAGIADGEGSFYLTATKDTTGRPVVKYSFAVGNTNLLMIKELQRIYQVLFEHPVRYIPIKGRGNRKQSWLIQITSMKDLVVFCPKVLPYLVAKKEQANLMLEFCNLGKAFGNQITGADVDLFEKRLPYVARMKHLNRYRTGAEENEKEFLSQQETELSAPTKGEETVRTSRRREELAEMPNRHATATA